MGDNYGPKNVFKIMVHPTPCILPHINTESRLISNDTDDIKTVRLIEVQFFML